MVNNFLSHYGIKGQKWGVRRYETEGGKLTKAGKTRYKQDVKIGKTASKLASDASKIGNNKLKSKTVKKDYSKISDQELKARVNRLNLERQYGQLTGETKKVRSGEDYIRESLQTIGSIMAVSTTALALYMQIKGRA